ncbi:MAG: Gfo/Idh/MocA family oxidoreductase [Alphaproteobacteria bacterium]|nr:Gfo/Idh/MocA family oxidoreductase [Alphaproteobacteria bacterium]
MNDRDFRWLVVGAGQAGQCHIAAIARTPGAALAGIVDPVLTAADVPIYRDIADGLKSARPDAVIVAAPNDLHRDIALTAIEAGIPVLCEKPVGRVVADADAIAERAIAKNVPAGVVLNQRTHACNRWVKNLIAHGSLEARSVMFSGAVPRLARWHSDLARSGGGALRTIAIHAVDLLVWWLGEPLSIDAHLGGDGAETVVAVTGRFAHGRIGSVHISAVADQGAGPVRCVIDGVANRIVIDGHRVTDHRGLPAPPAAEAHDPALKYGPGHLNLIAEASAALGAGRGFPIALVDALPTLRQIEQIYISTGRLTAGRATGR